MAKSELTDTQVKDVKAALLAGEPIPNPSGDAMVFDGRVDPPWRKATAEESREHDNDIDEVTAAARKAPAGNDNP